METWNLYTEDLEEGEINSVFEEGSHSEGDLEFSDSCLVKGSFEGSLRCVTPEGRLYIGEHGEVQGMLESPTIVIYGKFHGVAQASASIELRASAQVEADLKAPSVLMEEGCYFKGQTNMDAQNEKNQGGPVK